MAANFLICPDGSPLQIVEVDAPVSNTYHTIHHLQDWFANSIKEYQQKRDSSGQRINYAQKWQRTDSIKPQIAVPAGRDVKAYLINCSNTNVVNINTVTSQIFEGDVYRGIQCERYQFNFSLGGLAVPNGRYWFVVGVSYEALGSGPYTYKLFSGEPMQVRDTWPNTCLLEGSNIRSEYNIRFDMARKFGLRVDCTIGEPTFAYADSDFEDQQQNGEKLYSGKYKEYEITFGSKGRYQESLPAWMLDKISEFMRFNVFTIDAKQFYRPSNAAMDTVKLGDAYPLYNATITLRGYNEQENSVRGTQTVAFTLPGTYPYAISTLDMQDGGQPFNLVRNKVIEALSDVTAFVNTANNAGLEGSFGLDGTILTYTLGAHERFYSFTSFIQTKYTQFNTVYSSGANTIQFFYAGPSFVIDWGEPPAVQTISGPGPSNTLQVQHTYIATGSKAIRIFHQDTMTAIGFQTASGNKVSAVAGTLSKGLIRFYLSNQNIQSVDGTLFSPIIDKVPNLRTLAITSSQVVTVSSIDFSNNYNITNIDFSFNKLSVSEVNQLLYDFWSPGDYSNGGYFGLDHQTPPAAPTGIGLGAKDYLILGGWFVNTD